MNLWKAGSFPFEKLVKFYCLEDINQDWEDSKNGSVIKPIVKFAPIVGASFSD